jgi:hypothetical protein
VKCAAAGAHAAIRQLNGCGARLSNTVAPNARARRLHTEDARFAMSCFDTHFDGRDGFFDAFGIVGEAGDLCELGEVEGVRGAKSGRNADNIESVIKQKRLIHELTTADAASSSMFPSSEAV